MQPSILISQITQYFEKDKNYTIQKKITDKTNSYKGFAFNVTSCFLET